MSAPMFNKGNSGYRSLMRQNHRIARLNEKAMGRYTTTGRPTRVAT